MAITIVYVRTNAGNGRVKMRVYSPVPLSEAEINYFSTLTRDEAFNYGDLREWKVSDISDLE